MSWVESGNLKKTLTVTIAAGGTQYVVGDVLTIVQTNSAGATFGVASVNAGTGAVESVTMLTAGTGYYLANTLATTTDSVAGADCTLSITGVNYIGNHGRTGAGKYLLYVQYTKGNEDTAIFSMSFIKNSISTTTRFVSSPTDTATVAQQVFTITGTKNVIIPVTVPKCVDGVVMSLSSGGSAPTGTLVLHGVPELQWA